MNTPVSPVSIPIDLMYGRIKMMTALCLAWAHTHQAMRLGFRPEHLRQEGLQITQTQKKFLMLPKCPNITRMTGMASPSWTLVTDGGFKRQVYGFDLASWRITAECT